MRICLDCSTVYDGQGSRCAPCSRALDAKRNDQPNRRAYRDPAYNAIKRPIMACPCCGHVTRMTIDHTVPQAFGGVAADGMTYLCRRCNSSKGTGRACKLTHRRCTYVASFGQCAEPRVSALFCGKHVAARTRARKSPDP